MVAVSDAEMVHVRRLLVVDGPSIYLGIILRQAYNFLVPPNKSPRRKHVIKKCSKGGCQQMRDKKGANKYSMYGKLHGNLTFYHLHG
jgi:hypothetical protein